jgi:hypothetical protein
VIPIIPEQREKFTGGIESVAITADRRPDFLAVEQFLQGDVVRLPSNQRIAGMEVRGPTPPSLQ